MAHDSQIDRAKENLKLSKKMDTHPLYVGTRIVWNQLLTGSVCFNVEKYTS